MYKHKLIIVEGLTGLGKSTLAHFISRQLNYNGISADWIHEGEIDHPVSVEFEGDAAAFIGASLAKWQAFIDKLITADDVIVIEASFFNNLFETLFTQCVESEIIFAFAQQLEQIIQTADPVLIYLSHSDVTAALTENFRNRGAGFQQFVAEYVMSTPIAAQSGWHGEQGVMNFWMAFTQLTDSLYDRLNIGKLTIQLDQGDWNSRYRQLLEDLAIRHIPEPQVDPALAAEIVGDYQFDSIEHTLSITFEEELLRTDVFMGVDNIFIPSSDPLVFLMDKWHFKLVFVRNERGQIDSFTIAGRDIDYLQAVGMHATRIDKQKQA